MSSQLRERHTTHRTPRSPRRPGTVARIALVLTTIAATGLPTAALLYVSAWLGPGLYHVNHWWTPLISTVAIVVGTLPMTVVVGLALSMVLAPTGLAAHAGGRHILAQVSEALALFLTAELVLTVLPGSYLSHPLVPALIAAVDWAVDRVILHHFVRPYRISPAGAPAE